MNNLKAAAKRLRERASAAGVNYIMERDKRRAAAMYVEAQDDLLAAKALEALAWQAERGVKVIPWGAEWRCSDGEKIRAHADTPLGAILEAMEEGKHE